MLLKVPINSILHLSHTIWNRFSDQNPDHNVYRRRVDLKDPLSSVTHALGSQATKERYEEARQVLKAIADKVLSSGKYK